MSDQTLRQALESQLATLPTLMYDNGYPTQALAKAALIDLLSKHPAEPAPRPVIDREAVAKALHEDYMADPWDSEGCNDSGGGEYRSCKESYLAQADAVLALLGQVDGSEKP